MVQLPCSREGISRCSNAYGMMQEAKGTRMRTGATREMLGRARKCTAAVETRDQALTAAEVRVAGRGANILHMVNCQRCAP
jgi:hypothetical protein